MSKGQSKALRYLKLWYSNKKCKEDQSLEPWKFEKCRQIWLLQNCYSSIRVPSEDFKILLKYMSTINGRMRDGAIGEFCYYRAVVSGGAGGTLAPPEIGSSVNPIPTRGGRLLGWPMLWQITTI